MKYLSDYLENRQTALFAETGAFFAFGNKQFTEQKKPGVKYVSLGHGLVCPKCNASYFLDRMDKITEEAMAEDIAENGKKGVIIRELYNHECQITMDATEAVDAVKPYGIAEKEVLDVWPDFWDECVKNDYF